MIKKPPTTTSIVAMVVFAMSCFALLLYLWLSFGGSSPLKPQGYRLVVDFPEATQLASQADVRISGVNVGRVVKLSPASGNRTQATLQLDPRFAPIPSDTRALLRLKSLLGETYVELTPGSRSATKLPDGGTLPVAQVGHTVELDEILRTLDAPTRRAFQLWMQEQAQALRGRGMDVNAGFADLPEFVHSGDALLTVLNSQGAGVRRLVTATGDFFSAISAREGELRGLIHDSNRLFTTTAARNRQLADVFRALPGFEHQSRLTLPELTAFGDHVLPVVNRLRAAAPAMTQTFAATARLAPQLRVLFERLGPAVSASQKGLPAFEQILRQLPPLLDRFEPWLRNANPMIDYISRYRREVTAFFANFTGASLSRDNGLERYPAGQVHYLRTAQTLSPMVLSYYPRPPGQTRANAYPAPGALDKIPQGLEVLDSASCGNGDPAPPSNADPASLESLIQPYVFRTDGRDVARPPCNQQVPLFGTQFPQLRAEP
jgi:virulence factor Mce-like protein